MERSSYVNAPTQYIAANGKRLAYRKVGSGPTTLVMCNRFRGILDTWDPAFIDGLAEAHTVVTFDYGGLGLSTGPAPRDIVAMADDAKAVIDELRIERPVVLGWSLGGLVAQTFITRYPERPSAAVLIGTAPPGKNAFSGEQLFFDTASKVLNDLEDEVILFFEPISEASRLAAKRSHDRIAQRTEDLSVPVPPPIWPGLFEAGAQFYADSAGARQKLKETSLPILVIMGDHDIVFPVENWFALNRSLPTMQLVVFPRSGHGPQHEHIEASVQLITTFVRTQRGT